MIHACPIGLSCMSPPANLYIKPGLERDGACAAFKSDQFLRILAIHSHLYAHVIKRFLNGSLSTLWLGGAIEFVFIMKRAIHVQNNIHFLCARQGLSTPLLPASYLQRMPLSPHPQSTPHRKAMSSSNWKPAVREFPSCGCDLIDSSVKIEEELLPTYQPEKYYPVQQGEVLNDRYQVLAKLGYGVKSTVWFGRDLLCVQSICFQAIQVILTVWPNQGFKICRFEGLRDKSRQKS